MKKKFTLFHFSLIYCVCRQWTSEKEGTHQHYIINSLSISSVFIAFFFFFLHVLTFSCEWNTVPPSSSFHSGLQREKSFNKHKKVKENARSQSTADIGLSVLLSLWLKLHAIMHLRNMILLLLLPKRYGIRPVRVITGTALDDEKVL